MRIAYCPYCSTEISEIAFEAVTKHIYWTPCKSNKCRYSNVSFKSDEEGFVIEPLTFRGRYILTRNSREKKSDY